MTEYIELTSVGEMLKEEFIDAFGISQNALAKAIHVPPNRIHQIIKGDRRITADTDLRLCKYFGMSEGFFTGYQAEIERRQAKRQLAEELETIQSIQAAQG